MNSANFVFGGFFCTSAASANSARSAEFTWPILNKESKESKKSRKKNGSKEEEWRSTKKVGSLLGDEEDINRRKQLATASMNKINAIYLKKDKVKLEKKIKIYRA